MIGMREAERGRATPAPIVLVITLYCVARGSRRAILALSLSREMSAQRGAAAVAAASRIPGCTRELISLPTMIIITVGHGESAGQS